MSFPKKNDKDKFLRQSISFDPKDMDRLLRYCQDEERTLSWVVRKALNEWLSARGY